MDSEVQQTKRIGRHCQGDCDCENVATLRCSGCKKVWYCSARCQKAHWEFHIFNCNPNIRIRSSRYLLRACFIDLVPEDPQTLEDYGFNRVTDSRDKSMLLGLYQGLNGIYEHALDPRVLDQWMQEGSLVQHIKEAFERFRPDSRGQYYPWFLQNQWILDGSPPPYRSTAAAVGERMDTRLWAFLGPSRKAQLPNWSKEQSVCAGLYRLLLSHFHPGPHNSPQYVTFGFCVARDTYTEMAIARIYLELIHHCSFEEFCDAYNTSSLFSLMGSRGVVAGPHPQIVPRHFEHILRSRVMHESVWDLKQYLYGAGEITLIPSVQCDYGFMNCKQPDEIDELTAIYKTAFDHKDFDEMELHNHCIRGQIVEHVGKFQKLSKKTKKRLERLMKNPYPLPELCTLSVSS